MELFQFTKILFQEPEKWSDVSDSDKRRHFFMMNRFAGIQFPLQAHVLGHMKINPVGVMNFWQKFMRKQYKKVPYWMYTKGAKKSNETKDKSLKINRNILKEFCRAYEIEEKSAWDALEMFPEKLQKELKDFEKMIKQ